MSMSETINDGSKRAGLAHAVMVHFMNGYGTLCGFFTVRSVAICNLKFTIALFILLVVDIAIVSSLTKLERGM